MSGATNLGFPRIGKERELKRALESHWAGEIGEAQLAERAKAIRAANWRLQSEAGISPVPCNDFSLYDHALDTAVMVGAVPKRYAADPQRVDLATYFTMARGAPGEGGLSPMEMTKWFDTNYHYLVPELEPETRFELASRKPVEELAEARALGHDARPVILGPVSFLLLGKSDDPSFERLSLLDDLLPVYEKLLDELAAAGAAWVQVDEPFLAMDLTDTQRAAFERAYARLGKAGPRVLLATYFADLRDNMDTAASLPVAGLHLDLMRGPAQLEPMLERIGSDACLSLGLVDGRNVWKTDLAAALERAERVAERIGRERVMIAPSCSLLHVPVDLDNETALDAELRNWLAFAKQKAAEIALIHEGLHAGRSAIAGALAENAEAMESRRRSERIHRNRVQERAARVTDDMAERGSPFAERVAKQQASLDLPLLPTTTIGSFPQTKEVRRRRAAYRRGEIGEEAYNAFLREQTEACVRWQEEIGLDVLVHGELERNDMVEYFGEHFAGFTPTVQGWVQSYGSRCVKPPIIYGDLEREGPISVDWIRYAQSCAQKPVKGMLTAPVTILQWSFVRDDQPRSETCKQIALAVRDEVADLEAAGIRAIQIDEPALREGLPLRRADWPAYLDWAVRCFRLASSGVRDETQIHTHMCYAEFNDIIDAIGELDADVISIEASRSDMELLNAFASYRYPNHIGPGVWDIHSPRVPSAEEMAELIGKASKVLDVRQLWVNPDCGLKTRKWAEVTPALENMVAAAQRARESLSSETKGAGHGSA